MSNNVLYYDLTYKEPTRKQKSPSAKCQRAGNVMAPPIGRVQNF